MFFNGQDVDERTCLPSGVYNAVVTVAEQSENKARTGSFVKTVFEILNEAGFSVANWYNIEHENMQVEALGRRDFKKLVVASTGKGDLERLEDLIGKKVQVTLGQQEYMGAVQNNLKSVKAFDSMDTPF